MTQRGVDAHHHVWDLAVRALPWLDEPSKAPIRRTFGLPDLEPLARDAGVTATVVVQAATDMAETSALLAMAATSDLVAAVTGWVDLTVPHVSDALAALLAGPGGGYLRAVRHQVQGERDPRWLCRDDVRRGFRAVGAAGLAYELLTLPHQLPAAVETVRALPNVRFVLDHCSKPPVASGELEPWATGIRELAALPNVTCKLSGLVTEAHPRRWRVADLRPYAEVVLDAFGPGRLMFGSDWPVCTLAATYGEVVDAAAELVAQLSPDERDAVWAGTARRVYSIG